VLSREEPERFLSTVKKADRKGRILIDWLRNGLGATAVASFCPRARSGAPVATPFAWDQVTAKLEPSQFTLRDTPDRLARQEADRWRDFEAARRPLPDITRMAAPLASRRGGLPAVTTTTPKRGRLGKLVAQRSSSDGTLIDSVHSHVFAWKDAPDQEGVVLSVSYTRLYSQRRYRRQAPAGEAALSGHADIRSVAGTTDLMDIARVP
jgi:hypothetical protein